MVELSDSRYQGGGRPIYRLVVGAVPMAEEVYPIGGRRGETVGLEAPRRDARRLEHRRGDRLDPVVRVRARRRSACPIAALRPVGHDVSTSSRCTPLIVGELPELREPADPAAEPIRAAVPVALNGRIDPAGDEDRFVLAVTPGQKLRIEVDAADHGSALDGALQVLGAKGAVLATADDTDPTRAGPGGRSPRRSPRPTRRSTSPSRPG